MLNLITTLFGGRIAQQRLSGRVDNGAESDLEKASMIARKMVGSWGMSKLGPIHIPLDEKGYPTVHLDQELEALFSAEWRGIIKERYEEAEQIINKRLNRTRRVADAVLKQRTIDGEEFRRLWNMGDDPEAVTA